MPDDDEGCRDQGELLGHHADRYRIRPLDDVLAVSRSLAEVSDHSSGPGTQARTHLACTGACRVRRERVKMRSMGYLSRHAKATEGVPPRAGARRDDPWQWSPSLGRD